MLFMLRLFFISALSFFTVLTFAQPPQLGTTIEEEFKATAVPDKWKTESAVIIGQKTEYLFTRLSLNKKSAVVRINEYVHKRIKLQDKNSLENFSTFYYNTMGKDGSAEYKVIKSTGKEVVIDMKSAIEEEKDVPAIYKSILLKMNLKAMKIAIPDLEVGDIIDYTVRSTIDWDMAEYGIEFTPFMFSLANTYPTMYQMYRFSMVNGMKVRFKGLNGAPNIRYDAKSSLRDEKNSLIAYYFTDKDREKSTDERWSLSYRNTPTVKFSVVMLSDNEGDGKTLGEAMVDRSGLDVEKVYRRYIGAGAYVTPAVNQLVGYTTEYMLKKKADGTVKTDDDIIRETYYCLRKVFLETYYKGPVHSELEKEMSGKKLYKKVLSEEKKEQKEERQDEIRMSSVTFATALRIALAAVGVQSELFVYVPRKYGTWRDAMFTDELDFALRVKSKKKYYYLEAFNNFDAFGTPYPYMENAEGYAIGYTEANSYFRGTVAASVAADNIEKQEYKLAFSDAMDVVKADRNSTYTGAEKLDHIGKANLPRDYLKIDMEKYFNVPKSKKKDDIPLETSTSYENPDKEEKEKERTELFEKDLKAIFDVDKYLGFELIKDGRFGDSSQLQFNEKFTLKKLISKAGKNYIIEIGKITGSQIKLEPSELAARQTDIWINYARTFENNISLTIPAGYTVDGLQELNYNIDNESGAFISTASVDGDKLVINTKKIYKKSFDKKELWPNYIAFLEPAYKLSQAKIVLKKK
jgi:hypothetical protein